MNNSEKLKGEQRKSSQLKEKITFIKNNKWIKYSNEIALRILAVIENDKNLTQTKLAEKLNVTDQYISKIVKGRENLTLETIYKLSQAVGTELISFPEYSYSKIKLGESKTEAFEMKLRAVYISEEISHKIDTSFGMSNSKTGSISYSVSLPSIKTNVK